MNRQQVSWLIVRAFGVYLLVQAFMLGVHTLIDALIYIRLASSLGTNHDYVNTALRSYRYSVSAGLLAFVVFSATGIYFLRGGRFLMRWLQYVPGARTDADAQTIRPMLAAEEVRNLSVNQRLSAAGLFHEFADAVDRRDISDIEGILRQIGLTPDDIQTVIAQMLPTSA
ncbi:MAG TPA: hypothetical protein VE863_15345 [Pyrinomonadaceae bacterium]|nr:hypothetical protein [Pyrinomonadaceae bacterium]